MTLKDRSKLAIAIALVALVSFGAGAIAQMRYVEIDHAENALRNSLNDLGHARDVFGGHKQNAMGLINNAIGELEQGKGFAASHGY
jgi:hypothetical protein